MEIRRSYLGKGSSTEEGKERAAWALDLVGPSPQPPGGGAARAVMPLAPQANGNQPPGHMCSSALAVCAPSPGCTSHCAKACLLLGKGGGVRALPLFPAPS